MGVHTDVSVNVAPSHGIGQGAAGEGHGYPGGFSFSLPLDHPSLDQLGGVRLGRSE